MPLPPFPRWLPTPLAAAVFLAPCGPAAGRDAAPAPVFAIAAAAGVTLDSDALQ
ncbi:MAG: hypothetical protein ACREFA_02295 [Stellaceae bacterium]